MEKSKVIPGLRTLTGIRCLDLQNNYDYMLIDSFEGFNTVLTLSKWKSKSFNWDIVKLEASKKKTYLAISRRVNPYSPNTSFLAIFNSQKFVPSDGAFKLFKVEEEKYAKILCLSFNSIHYLIQFFRNKEETTGQYSTIRSDDLVLIDIINPEKLSEQEIQTLLTLFEKIKNVEFPSLMEQLQKRFWARVELDKTILKVLGLTDREIDEWVTKNL